MFFRKKNNTEVNQIEQNKEVTLYIGDSFGLLVDEYWFSIQPSDGDNDDLQANPSQSDGLTPSSKRKSSTDSQPDSTNKRVKTEPNEFDDETNEANDLSNGDLDRTIPTDSQNEIPSTSASSSSNIPQAENGSPVADRPIKPEPIDSDEVQSTPITAKTEPMSQETDVDSTNSTPVTVKTEVKSEPTDNARDDGATTSSGDVHLRECCRYGIRCYR